MGQQQAQPERELQAAAGTPGAAVFVVKAGGHGGLVVGEQMEYSGGYRLQRRLLESRQARWIPSLPSGHGCPFLLAVSVHSAAMCMSRRDSLCYLSVRALGGV